MPERAPHQKRLLAVAPASLLAANLLAGPVDVPGLVLRNVEVDLATEGVNRQNHSGEKKSPSSVLTELPDGFHRGGKENVQHDLPVDLDECTELPGGGTQCDEGVSLVRTNSSQWSAKKSVSTEPRTLSMVPLSDKDVWTSRHFPGCGGNQPFDRAKLVRRRRDVPYSWAPISQATPRLSPEKRQCSGSGLKTQENPREGFSGSRDARGLRRPVH